MKNAGLVGFALAFLWTVSAVAGSGVMLSPDDYTYLSTQGVARDHSVLGKMSPRELSRLHYVIIDQRTDGDPKAKSREVFGLLSEFEANQQWERDNPGLLWDDKKRGVLR